jgi:hypothetical protein
MLEASSTIDMTRGIYRRIYSGFLHGRRINQVSWMAEAWFWRLQALADDFGNFICDPEYLRGQAAPRRRLSPSRAIVLTDELVAVGLVEKYQIGAETFGHISGFENLQPPPRNGRRVRRVLGSPGESGGVRGLREAVAEAVPSPEEFPIPPPGIAGDSSAPPTALPATALEALMRFRVGEPALSILAPLVSPQEVHDALRSIRPGRKNHVGVLVGILTKAHGVTLPRARECSVGAVLNGKSADWEAAKQRARIERSRP